MSSQHLCPFCSFPLLCQISSGKLSWFCRHCHLEMPYGICQNLELSIDNHGLNQLGSLIQINKAQSQALKTIIRKTVQDLRQALGVTRVMVWQYNQKGELTVLRESVQKDYESLEGWQLGHLLTPADLDAFQQGQIQVIEDIQPQQQEQLEEFFEVKAKLVAPILIPGHPQQVGPKLWGLLVAHECQKKRFWQQSEISLFNLIANHLGLEINQNINSENLQSNYEKLEHLAGLDQLTRLTQKSLFEVYLEREWQKLKEEKSPLALILCDLDQFKLYNDHYGYEAGDKCLQKISEIIQKNLNNQREIAVRYGGEEFMLILPHTDGAMAVKIAEQLRCALTTLELWDAKAKISGSFGVASLIPTENFKSKDLVKAVEEALAKGKKAGGNQVIYQHLNSIEASEPNHGQTLEHLQSYLAYFLSHGKLIISPKSGPLYFRGQVYEYQGYHQNFLEFWQQLRERQDFADLYFQGDKHSFGEFLKGNLGVGQCARCNLLIPVPVGAAYDIPSCDLCHQDHVEGRITRIIALGKPFDQSGQLKQLCSLNRVLVTFVSNPNVLASQTLSEPIDLIIIDSQVDFKIARNWAKQLHQIPELSYVPIVALSRKAGNGLVNLDGSTELENYLLNPFNGKHLASYLRNLLEPELHWFPG